MRRLPRLITTLACSIAVALPCAVLTAQEPRPRRLSILQADDLTRDRIEVQLEGRPTVEPRQMTPPKQTPCRMRGSREK